MIIQHSRLHVLHTIIHALLGLSFYLVLVPDASAAQTDKVIIGQVEEVTIEHSDFIIQAKIDTGAENSSLNAANIHLAKRGKEKWISFEVTNKDGKTLKLERKIIRFVRIKRKEATTQQRPSVELNICLAGVLKKVEVNLVNRSNFNFQMLIGRSFLKGGFVVDVEQIFTHKPQCPETAPDAIGLEEN